MEVQDEKALLAAFRVMEPPVVLVSLARCHVFSLFEN